MSTTRKRCRKAPLGAALLAASGLSAAAAAAHAQVPVDSEYTAQAEQHHHHGEHYQLAQAASTLDAVTVQGEGVSDYAPKATPSVSGPIPLKLRETPRSVVVVTEERMQDEGLVSAADVLARTAGISFSYHNSQEGVHAISRGFRLDNILIDGLSLQGTQRKMPGDLALYEQVEIMRGPVGLTSGSGASGNMGGAINLVRKRPTRERRTSVRASGGSWSNYRGMVDTSGALNAEGSIRGRGIVSYIDREFFYDFAYRKNLTAGGSVEFDLTPQTMLTAGLDYEGRDARIASGRYFRNLDGSDPGGRRSSSSGMPWGKSEWNEYGAFVQLDHQFANDWNLKMHYVHKKWDDANDYATVASRIDAATQQWQYYISSTFGKGKYTDDGLAVNLGGAFDLFGRAHDFATGFTWQSNKYRTVNAPANQRGYGTAPNNLQVVDFPDMDYSRYPYRPSGANWSEWNEYHPDKQIGYYASVRLNVSDPLKVGAGFRVSRFSDGGLTRDYTSPPQYRSNSFKEKNEITPFVAISYDVLPQHTLHASYSEMFKVQNRYTMEGNRVDPLTGENWELSLKSDWNEGRLHSAFTLFRLDRTNNTQQVEASPCQPLFDLTGITDACYVAENKERVSGVEVELGGTVAPNWDVTVGLTAIKRKYAHWKDADGSTSTRQGQTFGNNDPTRTAQIWVLHRLQGAAQGWRAGLGLRAQNKVWSDIAANGPRPAFTMRQGGYATMNAMVSWEITPQWRAQLNVDNLTNRNYEPGYLSSSYINNSAPRSYMLSVSGRF